MKTKSKDIRDIWAVDWCGCKENDSGEMKLAVTDDHVHEILQSRWLEVKGADHLYTITNCSPTSHSMAARRFISPVCLELHSFDLF